MNGFFFKQERRDAIVADDGEVPRRVEPARRARLLRQRHEPQAVEDPARDRQHAGVGEVVEVLAERLGRVERVLGQRVRAGGRRRPRVDERRLDHVVLRRAPPHEAAAVVHVDGHTADPRRRRPSSRGSGPSITSRAMIGLISTPSTCVAPKTSADSRSRPPPGPMTSAVNPAGPLDELVGEGRQLVAQVVGVGDACRCP